ncbi:unnamed protein product [Sphenostylis stenocarpa]|uniref:Uncharacterized protein n=1 Tax=Sphenostylis stenocarpa TaxID=92480 RepID=A0AA86V894_9FABA|nr:unnamed protein product [Sphenostylis stenocarpa]
MVNPHTHRVLLFLRLNKFSTLRTHHSHHSLLNLNINPPFSLRFNYKFATVPNARSFAVSYLVSTCGFSSESALSASRNLHFDSPRKPDSVLAFFSAHGFSLSQIRTIVKCVNRILLCNPNKVLLPKFLFLRSKGASDADIVHMVTTGPLFLTRSLANHIVPSYLFVKRFFDSNKQTMACLRRNFCFISATGFSLNVQMLLDNGVKRSSIAKLLRMWPSILCSYNLSNTVRELKEMGFCPSTTSFAVALLAKRTVNKAKWGDKVEVFKKWGWSEEHVLMAFRRHPYCMLSSPKKIDAVFSFWVEELGYSSLELFKSPIIFQLSLQKRIVPRSLVLRFLAKKDLRKKGASYVTPFLMTENVFLEKFVNRYEKHSSQLLKMYEKSKNVANIGEEEEEEKKKILCL